MTLEEYKAIKMRDPEFAKAYVELQPEMSAIRAIINARTSQNLTLKELSARTGIKRSKLRKLEEGMRNPSIRLLQKLADGLDMTLEVTFKPKNSDHKDTK
jgi:transcriptional regulator with XRE-family HTH domain